MKLGLIVRSDHSGLASQTRNLAYMLKPDRLMVIDSTPFNQHIKPHMDHQHPEWFEGFECIHVQGFPMISQQNAFLRGLTHVMSCEIPYGYTLFSRSNNLNIKSYLVVNPEFAENYQQRFLPRPTKFIAPSPWRLDELNEAFPGAVELLPPPTFPEDFAEARKANLARTGKRQFLHVAGTAAMHDRAGTQILLEALKFSNADYALTIKSQHDLGLFGGDDRVTFDTSAPEVQAELYNGYDAMVQPRRYGGLNLPVNEGLMSGLPVVMPDISPNNALLPPEWLVPAYHVGEFMARMRVDLYDTDLMALGAKLDEFATMSDSEVQKHKTLAFEIGYNTFSPSVLKPQYEALFNA